MLVRVHALMCDSVALHARHMLLLLLLMVGGSHGDDDDAGWPSGVDTENKQPSSQLNCRRTIAICNG